MKQEPITCVRIDERLRFLPLFDVPGKKFIEHRGGDMEKDGTIVMSHPTYLPEVLEFFSARCQSMVV